MYNKYFSDYQEPNTWEERYQEVYNNYKQAVGLKEVLTFREQVLGDSSEHEKLEMVSDIAASMRQIIPNQQYGELLDLVCIDDPNEGFVDALNLLTNGNLNSSL